MSRLRKAFGSVPEIPADQDYELPSNVVVSASTVIGSDQWRAMGLSEQSATVASTSALMITSVPLIPVFSPALKPLRSLPSVSLSYDMASTAKPVLEAYRIVNEVSGGRATDYYVESTAPPLDCFGPTVVVEVNADAREALEILVKAAREARGKGFILDVKWTGKTDVTADEAIRYLVRALVEMEIPLFIDPDFDSVKAVREMRRGDAPEAKLAGMPLDVLRHLRPHLSDTP